jgi:hypothetical protein
MYTIISPRLGTPGDEFIPAEGVNIDALLERRPDIHRQRKEII